MLHHLASLLRVEITIVLSYLWASLRGKLFGALTPDERSALHRRNARRFVRTASKLKGANVKLGQFASMQAHLLPREYIEELKVLRDAVRPTEYGQIAALLRLLFRGLKSLFKRVDLALIVRESEEPLRRELDLTLEAKATEHLGGELAALGVVVPKVHWELGSRRVLTLEFIEGPAEAFTAQIEPAVSAR